MLEQLKQAFKTGFQAGRMDNRGQGGMNAAFGGMLFLAAGTILVSIVAITYNGIDKSTLIGGSEPIGDLIPLVAVSGVVLGGLVAVLFGLFTRR